MHLQLGDLVGVNDAALVDVGMLEEILESAERDAASRSIRDALGPRLGPSSVRAAAAAAFGAIAESFGIREDLAVGGKGSSGPRVAAGKEGLGRCLEALGASGVSDRFLAAAARTFAADAGRGLTSAEFQSMVFAIYSSRD